MFSLIYNLALFLLAIIALPKLLWQCIMNGKYRQSLKARLGITLPNFTPIQGKEVIWIHAVSMGETRAVIPLFRQIQQSYPDASIVISTTSETGHAEAKRSMPQADAHFILPIDFSWTIRRLLKHLQPSRLILCESDFWYHLLQKSKERGVRIDLINGKVSERSCRRFQKFGFFTRELFTHFDHLCVQSQRFYDRFLAMGIPAEKISVTGNLKFDSPTKKMPPDELDTFKDTLGIAPDDRVLVIGSTHAPEEEMLLSVLAPIWQKIPHLKVILVPRHPERFDEVANLIQQKNIPFHRFSQNNKGKEPLILIDAMGKLTQCYQIADAAIVAGSYVAHVGGHNILEPIAFDVPVLFGPYMHSQPDLEEVVLAAGAGKKVSLEEFPVTLLEILENPQIHRQYANACRQLSQSTQGATQRTFNHLFQKAIEV